MLGSTRFYWVICIAHRIASSWSYGENQNILGYIQAWLAGVLNGISWFSRSSGHSATEVFGNFSELWAQNLKCDVAFDAVSDDALITWKSDRLFFCLSPFSQQNIEDWMPFFPKDVIFFKVSTRYFPFFWLDPRCLCNFGGFPLASRGWRVVDGDVSAMAMSGMSNGGTLVHQAIPTGAWGDAELRGGVARYWKFMKC